MKGDRQYVLCDMLSSFLLNPKVDVFRMAKTVDFVAVLVYGITTKYHSLGGLYTTHLFSQFWWLEI